MSTVGEPPFYLEARWDQYLKDLFDEPDRSAVVKWLKRHSGEGRVVIVGAGFTRNAVVPVGVKIPLWSDQTEALKSELGLPSDASFSDLELPDVFEEQRPRGKHPRDLPAVLRDLMPDEQLKPGRAHEALWASNPVAVITTNYLDTTLEKSPPSRFRRVVDDSQLGPTWGEGGLCPLIYFHGHRARPETWVTGRRHYDTIEAKRPILSAKIRQLIAEYPVLIVGYSLSDPDFHSIYRSTTDAMDKKHPGALALMRPVPHGKKKERELASQYWRQNLLSIVSFRSDVGHDLDEAHARFFKLTLQPTKRHQFKTILESCPNETDIVRCFSRNLRAVESALDCERWDEPAFIASDGDRRRAWQEVLEVSVTPKMLQVAQRKAGEAIATASARTRIARGEKLDAREVLLASVDASRWLFGSVEQRNKVRGLIQFLPLDSNETWLIEQLIGTGPGRRKELRQLVREWLQFGFEKDAHRASGRERGMLAALGILTDGDEQHQKVWTRLARNHGDLLRAAGMRRPRRSTSTTPSLATERLALAREHLLAGRREEARAAYQRHLEEISTATLDTFEHQLQGFFAAQGLLEAKEPLEYGASVDRAVEQRAQYRSMRKVSRWVEHVRRLGDDILKSKAERKLNAFESTSFHWSVAPRDLHQEMESAEQLGCPPFWLRDNLLKPLLGEIPSARQELELRLKYAVKDTGSWVKCAVEKGEFDVNRASPFETHGALSSESRRRAQVMISRALCRFESPTYSTKLEALRQAQDLICKADIPAALKVASQTRVVDRFDDPRFQSLLGVSHLVSWSRVREPLFSVLKDEKHPRDYFELYRVLPSLPWEQWVLCDNFLQKQGLELLTFVCRARYRKLGEDSQTWPFAENVGFTLSRMLILAPNNDGIKKLARTWLRRVARQRSNELLSATTLLLGQLGGHGAVVEQLVERVKSRHLRVRRKGRTDLNLLSIAADAPNFLGLRQWAHQELYQWADSGSWVSDNTYQGFGSQDLSHEAWALAFLVKHHHELRSKCRNRLFALMDYSWDVLPQLSQILTPEYWEGDWERLRGILAFGGRKRDVNSWHLARFSLIDAVTFDELPTVSSLHPELRFLYRAALDAVANSENRIANHATYSALLAAPFFQEEAEQKMVALAIQSSADDVRISVAHGAAFAAGYWQGLNVESPILRKAATDVRQFLRDDPAAIIHRQYKFGLAKGKLGRRGGAFSV